MRLDTFSLMSLHVGKTLNIQLRAWNLLGCQRLRHCNCPHPYPPAPTHVLPNDLVPPLSSRHPHKADTVDNLHTSTTLSGASLHGEPRVARREGSPSPGEDWAIFNISSLKTHQRHPHGQDFQTMRLLHRQGCPNSTSYTSLSMAGEKSYQMG